MRSNTDTRLIRAFSPSPVRTAWAMQASLITGSMPGMAASTSETWLFGSPPNSVEAPENSFALEATCACTSMPITTSQSPVAPLISMLLPLFLPFCILRVLPVRGRRRAPCKALRRAPGVPRVKRQGRWTGPINSANIAPAF